MSQMFCLDIDQSKPFDIRKPSYSQPSTSVPIPVPSSAPLASNLIIGEDDYAELPSAQERGVVVGSYDEKSGVGLGGNQLSLVQEVGNGRLKKNFVSLLLENSVEKMIVKSIFFLEISISVDSSSTVFLR